MSEKGDQLLAALDALMKVRELHRQNGKEPLPTDDRQVETPQSAISSPDFSSIKTALDTLLKMKEKDQNTKETAEHRIMEDEKPEGPQSRESEPDYIPEQSISSYSPKHEFSWQNETRIAYNPARPRPAREEKTGTPSLYSWPMDRRQERKGASPTYRMPVYRYREERFVFDGKSKNLTAFDAQPSRSVGRDSASVRANRVPYRYYKPNQA